MRLALVGSAVVLSLVASLAGAQVSSSSLDVEVKVPQETLNAGEETPVLFTVRRHCASPAQVLPEQVVDVAVHARDANATVTGPGQVLFAQQTCATQPEAVAEVRYGVRTPLDAEPGSFYEFHAMFDPRSGGMAAIAGSGNQASIAFTVGVADELRTLEEDGSAASTELEAPALPSALLATGLLVAAFALRRR